MDNKPKIRIYNNTIVTNQCERLLCVFTLFEPTGLGEQAAELQQPNVTRRADLEIRGLGMRNDLTAPACACGYGLDRSSCL